ncbi:unnamed protein product [Phytophthora fragariaefolia]|uniref:Unnamed protein product n=1 Tax=Phytophthora fragariaefolia TaxID=1490495 RepID=A0A9W6XXM6_9STRA|nr:unnamed protein product [Phytophthora fragariaefolia]
MYSALLFTQVIVESETCNNPENIEKRREFGGGSISLCTIFIVNGPRRGPIGERVVVNIPPLKQLQCAVSPEVGLVHYEKRRGSIKMEVNAGFVDSIYDAVKQHDEHAMPCMDLHLVNKMARHCALFVAAASRSEPMEYGT